MKYTAIVSVYDGGYDWNINIADIIQFGRYNPPKHALRELWIDLRKLLESYGDPLQIFSILDKHNFTWIDSIIYCDNGDIQIMSRGYYYLFGDRHAGEKYVKEQREVQE